MAPHQSGTSRLSRTSGEHEQHAYERFVSPTGPLGGLLSQAAMIAENDRRDRAALVRLWDAMVAHREPLLAARQHHRPWDAGVLYNVARQFLRHAVRPTCDGCGAVIAVPAAAERLQFQNARNYARFDGLVCGGDHGTGAHLNPCAQACDRTRRQEGRSRIITHCGPLSPEYYEDFAAFRATPDGALVARES